MSDHLAEALQEAWNDWCSDTGCVPDGFHIRGPATTRVTADFNYYGLQFVRNVTSALGRAGYRIVPAANVTAVIEVCASCGASVIDANAQQTGRSTHTPEGA